MIFCSCHSFTFLCLQVSSQRSQQDSDSEGEAHRLPVEEADDSLVEVASTSSQARSSRSRSTSSKRGKGSASVSAPGSSSVVSMLESLYTKQKECEQRVNIINKYAFLINYYLPMLIDL